AAGARAGVAGDQREAELGRHPLGARLGREGLLGAGEAGQVVDRRHRAALRRRRQVEREAHRAGAGDAVVLVEALDPAEGAVLGERGRWARVRVGHQNSTTVRIDAPWCMRSNASLIRSSGRVCVMSGSISIFLLMYQSTMRGTSVRPRAPPNAEPFHTRPVTSWNGRVEISWPAPATPMMTLTPQPRWQHSSAWRMRPTLPTHSKL